MGMFGNAFKPGGTGRQIAGIIGDGLLGATGQRPVYGPAVAEARQQRDMLDRQMMLAQYKAQNPDPTGTMQNVTAAGFTPGTPEYQAYMKKLLMQPRYITLGNAEQGQTVIDANEMGGPSAPPPPQIGYTEDGHTYIGGDPANPASWKAQ
jgi:hypothetical protein